MKYLLLFLAFVTLIARSQEQIEKCGSHIEEAKLWEENPELKAAYYELRNTLTTQKHTNTYTNKKNQVYTIPIVFHVLHEYGDENISDEQIYRQVEILNEDFRKLNSDTTDIVPEFKGIAADAKIEFVLASVDPFGNCSNGITRHYSSETMIGDDYSKLEQWPRSRYLNVWTVKSMEGGTAGYAYFPTSVEGANRFRDGIIIRHNYIGDIGTSNPHNSRALTHEIGHYLGLAHTWGPGNDPGLAENCQYDDGIDDTPNTRGWTTCDLAGETCDSFLDNVQNFMEYSYCSNMYTQGQVDYMHNILNLEVGQRSNLWSQTNLDLSIPENGPCDPIADFYSEYLHSCVGESIEFQNSSWRLSGSSQNYTWEFQDGTADDPNAENPTVVFHTPGWKDVTLTVEDNGLSNTIVKEDFIYISPEWSAFSGTHQFDFENNTNDWIVLNPQNHESKWEALNDVGKNGGGGIFLDVTSPYTNPYAFSDEFFFNERKGGVKHSFISQGIDLRYVSDINISFDWACATNGTKTAEMTEKLVVYTSTNCGKTWIPRKTISGPNLVNNGSGWSSFYPNSGTFWSNESFNLSTSSSQVLIKFEYTSSDKSNNIAIDNININGVLSTESLQKEDHLSIYPNPTNQSDGWTINYDPAQWGGSTLQLTDMTGRIISTNELPVNQSKLNIKPNTNATQGVYILKVVNGEKVIQNKLILK